MKRHFRKTGEHTMEGETYSPIQLEDGKPPRDIVLFQPGVNQSDYGPITFDAKAAEMVLGEFQRKGNPLYIDWNHGHAIPKEKRTREQGAAAGEFKLEVRDGALVAAGIDWNEAGFGSVAKRDYNLFSPWFAFEEDDDGVVRPTCLMNFALVNRAGLDHQKRIAAGAADDNDDQGATMTPEEIKALQDKLTAANAKTITLEGEVATLKSKGGVLALAAIVGVTSEAEVGPVVASLVKGRTDVLLLAGKDDMPAAIGVIKGWKENAAQVAVLVAKDLERETVALEAEFTALLDKGIKELRIDPAGKDATRKMALAGYGGKVTKEAVAEFGAYLPSLAPRGHTRGSGPTPAPGPKTGTVELSADQKAFIQAHGGEVKSVEKAIAHETLYLDAKAAKDGRASA